MSIAYPAPVFLFLFLFFYLRHTPHEYRRRRFTDDRSGRWNRRGASTRSGRGCWCYCFTARLCTSISIYTTNVNDTRGTKISLYLYLIHTHDMCIGHDTQNVFVKTQASVLLTKLTFKLITSNILFGKKLITYIMSAGLLKQSFLF